MTKDQTDAIRLIQSGLDQLGHSPGALNGQWGVRTARALKSLLAANGRAAALLPPGTLPWISEAKSALGRHEARDRSWLMDWVRGSVPRKLLAGGMKSDLLVVPHDCLGVWHEGRQPACPIGRLPA